MSVADMLIEEGFARGVEKGREEMRVAAAKMLKDGFSPEMIIRYIGISQQEIEKLIAG